MAVAAVPAAAHIVVGAGTLSQHVADADVVARARVLDGQGMLNLAAAGQQRPVVEAELLEVLKGGRAPGPVRFAQHGHGVAEFADGAEVLLFLRRIERTRELAVSPLAGAIRYVSIQEHDAGFPLTPATRATWLAAARAYVALESSPDLAAGLLAKRRLTLELIRSEVPRIAQGALRDLVVGGGLLAPTAAELPALTLRIADPTVPIGLRVGLLAELHRRGLAADAPAWTDLLRTTHGPDLEAVVRAAGAHPSPGVTTALVGLLQGDDPILARAAAIALGSRGSGEAVAPLAAALSSDDERLRMAAIRGLGRIGTAAARTLLEATARGHADPATRRRARAEATLLARSTDR